MDKNSKKKVVVKLTAYDWYELANFVRGDLANMPEGDEVREQMERICAEIIRSIGGSL